MPYDRNHVHHNDSRIPQNSLILSVLGRRRFQPAIFAGFSILLGGSPHALPKSDLQAGPALLTAAPPETEHPQKDANTTHSPLAAVVGTALLSPRPYARLRHLSDWIGPRLSGSSGLAKALDWAEKELRSEGHLWIRRQKVMIPSWRRGQERLRLIAPITRELHILGIGGSVGTPRKGLSGEVLVVHSFDELSARAKDVKGRIVLFQPRVDLSLSPTQIYSSLYPYRAKGAARAGALGALAVLVRSLTTRSLQSPHTGGLWYGDAPQKIPAAAITLEDAGLLERLAQTHPVRVRLHMKARQGPDVPSANLIVDLPGRTHPEEIVLVGAHIDSWDIGTGAHDDGAGVVVAMEAIDTIQRLGLRPYRTIRLVLFTNEENGLRGARAYADEYGHEPHFAAFEADLGGGIPKGLTVEGPESARAKIQDLIAQLRGLGLLTVRKGHAGADLMPLVEKNVLGIGLLPDTSTYFDIHHTAADTFDKIDPVALHHQAAAVAGLIWLLAEAKTLGLPSPIKPPSPALEP